MPLDKNKAGIKALQRVVVLMMENRSFDHMLGGLKARNPKIDGLTGNESNADTTGALVQVQPLAEYQSQLDPDPNHHFGAVNLQIFGDPSNGPPLQPTMQGFVKSYFNQQQDVAHSREILYYFAPEKLPVLTTLATEFAVFNRCFSSIPGPTICNRAFAHYGTSFGQVSMNMFYVGKKYKSIYERLLAAGHKCKLYYYDEASSTMEVVNLLQNQPSLFGTFSDFLNACDQNALPSTPSWSRITPTTTHWMGAVKRSPVTSILITTCVPGSSSSQLSITASARTRSSGQTLRSRCVRRTWRHLRPCSAACVHARRIQRHTS